MIVSKIIYVDLSLKIVQFSHLLNSSFKNLQSLYLFLDIKVMISLGNFFLRKSQNLSCPRNVAKSDDLAKNSQRLKF